MNMKNSKAVKTIKTIKTVGLLGGMSWESTLGYYQRINQEIHNRLGGLHSAPIILNSVDFAPLEALMKQNDWNAISGILVDEALKVQAGGADFLLICTNTMHKAAPAIETALDIPLVHIGDCAAGEVVSRGISTVGLLGTAQTMEQDFLKGRFKKHFDLDVLVPAEQDRKLVDSVIFNELCHGKIESDSKMEYLRIINDLVKQGAEAVILGCTEIGLLVHQSEASVLLVDTAAAHARAAVQFALNQEL